VRREFEGRAGERGRRGRVRVRAVVEDVWVRWEGRHRRRELSKGRKFVGFVRPFERPASNLLIYQSSDRQQPYQLLCFTDNID
jgi:hypothetical protein